MNSDLHPYIYIYIIYEGVLSIKASPIDQINLFTSFFTLLP
jgi:hypothetical protein